MRKKLGLHSVFLSVTKQKESRPKKRKEKENKTPPIETNPKSRHRYIEFHQVKKICMSDDPITNEKDRQQNEKTHFQIIYLIKNLSLEYIKSNYNSITKGKSIKKQADDFNG